MGKVKPAGKALGRKKPRTSSVWLPDDPELYDETQEAEAEVRELQDRVFANPRDESWSEQLSAASDRAKELRDRLKANSTKYVFKSLGPKRYDRLVNRNQPTEEDKLLAEEQQEGGGQKMQFGTSFIDALISHAMVEPVDGTGPCSCGCQGEEENGDPAASANRAEILEFINSDQINVEEKMSLFGAALQANVQRQWMDLGNASGVTAGSTKNSRIASPGGSRTPSS